MQGRAQAPGAGTILNAIATGVGAAFAIDIQTEATVILDTSNTIHGTISEDSTADTSLIEECVALTIDRYGDGSYSGGTVETKSSIPLAAGLKSSSAAANATILATLQALDCTESVDPLEATRVGVEAARNTGVTITGAFDDASASMLGGITMTDNSTDALLLQDELSAAVAVHTPPEQAFSADTDVEACRNIAPIAELVSELVRAKNYGGAMTVNGLAYAAALGYSHERTLEALPHVKGVSLSGTGPSTVAIGDESAIDTVMETWTNKPGTTIRTTTNADGATLR